MAIWPAGLPQKLNQAGFSNSLADNVIRSEMDVGPDKKRRRDVSAPEPVKGSMYVTESEYSLLKTFHDTTLGGGSLPFDWVHPITGASVEMTFKSPPTISSKSGDVYMATLDLEVLSFA